METNHIRGPSRISGRTPIGISSKRLAELAKVNDAQVRRDLSYLGTLGTRGVGYDVSTLRNQLQL